MRGRAEADRRGRATFPRGRLQPGGVTIAAGEAEAGHESTTVTGSHKTSTPNAWWYQADHIQAVQERIRDQPVLKLLRAMLRAGVMADGAVMRSAAGTSQGGVLSPCLANVYLHRLDRQWADRGTGVLVRYADRCGSPHR